MTSCCGCRRCSHVQCRPQFKPQPVRAVNRFAPMGGGYGCGGSVQQLMCRQNRILEDLARTLRYCCGAVPAEETATFSTGSFTVPVSSRLYVNGAGLRACQEVVAVVRRQPGCACRGAEVETIRMSGDGQGECGGQFPGVFSAGERAELTLTAPSDTCSAVLRDLEGRELITFHGGCFCSHDPR